MDRILLALQTLISSALGSTYTVLYGGGLVPASNYPLVSIEPSSTEMTVAGTGGLRMNTFSVDITLHLDLKDYMSDATSTTIQTHLQALVKIMEERNTDGTPKSTTILGCLNNDLSLGGTVHTMELGTIQYGGNENNNSYIRTAKLSITAVLQTPLCNI